MADEWVRSVQTNENNNGFFGRSRQIDVNPGQTVLRAWWNIGLYYLTADVNQYPPGSSILRAGVAYLNKDTLPALNLTPITDWASDWMAITTVNPSVVQLSRATNVAWQINWGFPIDLSIKSMRRNDTEDTYVLQTAWEMQLNDEESGLTLSGWWSSIDALIRTP